MLEDNEYQSAHNSRALQEQELIPLIGVLSAFCQAAGDVDTARKTIAYIFGANQEKGGGKVYEQAFNETLPKLLTMLQQGAAQGDPTSIAVLQKLAENNTLGRMLTKKSISFYVGGQGAFYDDGTPRASITKKGALQSMLRMDKNLAFTQWLFGTHRPSFFSVQVFDHWIMNYDRDDDIAAIYTMGAQQAEHETMITAILGLNYFNDRINPTLAGGCDLTYGGFFAIPAVDFVFGDHWRLRLEANLFFPSGQKDISTTAYPRDGCYLDTSMLPFLENTKPFYLGHDGMNENATTFLGYFANNDQFLLRLTYQF